MANQNPSPATRFKKGEVNNPGGRPKGSSTTAELNRLAEQMVKDIKDREVPRYKAQALVLWQEALNPKSKHFQYANDVIYTRREGKVLERIAQSVDLSGGGICPRAIIPTPEQTEAKETNNG